MPSKLVMRVIVLRPLAGHEPTGARTLAVTPPSSSIGFALGFDISSDDVSVTILSAPGAAERSGPYHHGVTGRQTG